jgi:DNA-nicking Smr family endonuclease
MTLADMPEKRPEEPVAIPITGELDLHTFRPAEISGLLDDYFTECLKRGRLRVRVVHGKGTGTLRTTVHAHLRRSPLVASFGPGDEATGGWGAIIVTLKAADSK